jgi:hypothetical protein
VAIYIVSTPAGTNKLGATQDLGKALAAQRRSIGRDAELRCVWWVSNLEAALELAKAAGPAPGSVEVVEVVGRRIREAARRRRIPLAEHGPTLERARTALARLDRGLALAKATGTLSFFNSRYKFCRRKAQAEGRPFLSYGTAHSRLKSEIARRIAEAGSGTLTLEGIVDAVLPLK